MSRNTKKIEAALLAKGLVANVTWTPMAKEGADGGIDGFHSDEIQGAYYRHESGQLVWHSGWMGYSVEEVLTHLQQVDKFLTPEEAQVHRHAVKFSYLLSHGGY